MEIIYMAEFYLKDLSHRTIKNEEVVEKNKLFFKGDRDSFEGVATREHVRHHPAEFENFKKANPSYKLPANFTDVEIGTPQASDVSVGEKVVDGDIHVKIDDKEKAHKEDKPKAAKKHK